MERFIQQHCNAYVSIQACTEHVRYQLLNNHALFGYVLDATKTSDAPLLSDMANIEVDKATTGKRNNFESAISYILPKDTVSKLRNKPNKLNQS